MPERTLLTCTLLLSLLLPCLAAAQSLSAGAQMWQRLENASWILDGKKDAPVVVYVFTDPYCPYCKQFWQKSRPWAESGKVQFRTLLVGVIKPESTPTAIAILSASDPSQAWHNYEQSPDPLRLTPPSSRAIESQQILRQNRQFMDDLGASATPAIYYLNKDHKLQQSIGVPDNEKMKEIMGE